MFKRIGSIVLRTVIGLFVMMAVPAPAQVSRTSGSLVVAANDQSGAAVAGATVTVTNEDNGQQRTALTGQDGEVVLSGLAPGTYDVSVSAKSFATSGIRGVHLGLGAQSRVSAQLKPQALNQELTVTAEEAMIDPSQTAVATTIDTERIEESPVVSRNYLDFVLLAPGLTSSNQQANANRGVPQADSGFSFAGQRPRSNVLFIDGVENNDEFTGATRTELSLELVREFQVVNNGLTAEAGGGSGGSINVITRSGVNTLHGNAFVFFQNGALNARDKFLNEPEKPDTNKFRGGLALGGPIIRDKTFFYVAGEQETKNDEASSAIDPTSAAALNAILAANSFPALSTRQINPGFSPSHRAETEASGRLDQQFRKNTATLRYSFNNNREAGDAFNAGALNDASMRGSSFAEDHTLIGGLTLLLGQSAVNEAHLQASTRRVVLRSSQDLGPEIDIVGVARFGRPYEGNLRRHENHLGFADSVTVSKGDHLFKFGGGLDHIHENLQSFDGTGGLYTFLSIPDFAAGRAYQYRQRFGSPNAIPGATKLSIFGQDHWKLTQNLTADVGLRHDYEQLPDRFNEDANNLAPRLGLAFSPWPKWVFRGGFGVFYDRYPLAFLSKALLNDSRNGFEQVVDLGSATTLFQSHGGGPLGSSLASPISVYQAEPDLRTAYSEQAHVGAEHLIFRNTTITATYLFSRGIHLSRTRNVDLGQPVILTPANAAASGILSPVPQQVGRAVFVESPASGIRDIFQLEDRGGSVFHGAFLGLRSKLSEDVNLAANYTFSKCADDASDYFEQPDNPSNLQAERALCAFDQRHRFVVSGTFEIGQENTTNASWLSQAFSHIELAPIITIGSSRPLNATVGFDANLSHSFPLFSRPLGAGRNSLRTGGQSSVDLRALKYFKIGEHGKLDLVAEGFNLLNQSNVLARQSEFGPNLSPLGNFTRPILGGASRQLQFSIDFEF